MARRMFMGPGVFRISRPGFDAGQSLSPQQVIFDLNFGNNFGIIASGIATITLNRNGVAIPFNSPGFIPAAIVNRAQGSQSIPMDFVNATDQLGSYWASLWGYRVYSNRIEVYKQFFADRNGAEQGGNPTYDFRYCVFNTPFGFGS